MFTFLAKPIGYLMALVYRLIDNYGISIIILTVVVRLCLVPMYAKQIKYSAAMADLQPKIQDLQKRYAHDKNTLNQKMNELYQQENVSPLSGCLPLIIQMPIIFGLYAVLREPLKYLTTPEMIAAVHESFLWVPDLSQPDTWILPIIAGVSTFFTYTATSASGDPSANAMKSMQYFFPVMIFLLGRSFPAGLALYWAVGNVFMIFQTLYFNKKRKQEKLRKTAEETVRKNRK
jgi:YidC/Oxa1 family membrane protein insertase